MYKFNNNHIVTGYIKELLSSFNLPKIKVFESEDDFKSYYGTKLDAYAIIKNYKGTDSYICKISKGVVESKSVYIFGKRYPNITSTLKYEDNTYDYHTHIYLGNYLRFIRDYTGVDLMPLYNCYSGKVLDYNDKLYVIVPIKFYKNYTIALSGKYRYMITYNESAEDIYKEFSAIGSVVFSKISSFEKPYLISNTDEFTYYYLFKEDNLKLVFELSGSDDFELSVLEGDFTSCNSKLYKKQYNFDKDVDYNNIDFNSQLQNLQLLKTNYSSVQTSYPFSDKLVGYLCEMFITPNDSISQNIVDAKIKVLERYGNNPENPGEEPEYHHLKSKMGFINASFTNEEKIRFMDAYYQTKFKYKDNLDLLGFVDNDIEQIIDDETRQPEVN